LSADGIVVSRSALDNGNPVEWVHTVRRV